MSSKDSSKNVVIVSFNAVGHVNGCRGAFTKSLACRPDRFRCYFLLEKSFMGQLEPYGFHEIIYEVQDHENKKPGEHMAKELLENEILCKLSIEERLERTIKYFAKSKALLQYYQAVDDALKRLMKEVRIDLFIIDDSYLHPIMFYSDIPLVRCVTSAPFVYAMDKTLPPPFTGLPSNSDPKLCNELRQKLRKMFDTTTFDNYVVKLGYEKYPSSEILESRVQLTVYAYPKELNHWIIESGKPKWFNVEVFNKEPLENKVLKSLSELVPKEFFDDNFDGRFSGKWIYLSLGSMGSVDLKLMKRLIETLSKTKHKYIVSKGPRANEYDLPSKQMYGERFLPQTQILPLVDLVITHGGNNTVTETFAQGKPMIVMPLFCDQFDNAQRLVETKFGMRVDPYDFEEQDLLNAIEKLLYDQALQEKLRRASERIQRTDSHAMLAEKIEHILNNNQKH